ncbi:MAG: helix-turn-helix domain-containing protein [Acidimicrobiales bacterium]
MAHIDAAASKLMGLSQAAQRFGSDRQILASYARSGQLPARRLGQEWLVHEDDIKEFIAGPFPVSLHRPPTRWRQRAQLNALSYVATHPGATVVDLAQDAGLPRRTALEYLQAIDRAGLITRTQAGPTILARCHLTPAGWALYNQHQTDTASSVPAGEEEGAA